MFTIIAIKSRKQSFEAGCKSLIFV